MRNAVTDVRFGSKADHVRFTPESDAECVHSNVRLKACRSTECSARPHPALQDQGPSQRIAALHYLRMAAVFDRATASSSRQSSVSAG
jgi:hypothetical protein